MGLKNKTSKKMFTEKDVITQKMKRNKTGAKVFAYYRERMLLQRTAEKNSF